MNKRYWIKLCIRVAMLSLALGIFFLDRTQYTDFFTNFFGHLTWVHVIWVYLMWEMISQLFPIPSMPTGCMKQHSFRFVPTKAAAVAAGKNPESKTEIREQLRPRIREANIRALITLIIWFVGNAVVVWLPFILGRIDASICLLISTLFTVFDLICILVVCPFQLIFMNTKCCSTCRIFNYGQIFTVTPIMLIPGFAAISLVVVAVIIFLFWELQFYLHPERFFEETNACLSCAHCTDRLCTSRNAFYRVTGIAKLRTYLQKRFSKRIK